MKTRLSTRRARGFTLMELLVVISIIVILAALTVGGFNYANQKQARSKAKLQIELLQNALEEYKMDTGGYPVHPVSNGKNGTAKVYKALYPTSLSEKVYLADLNPDSDKQGWLAGQTGTNLKLYDPWGTEYFFRTNNPAQPDRSIASNPDFDLWSAGPDGKTQAGSNGDYDPNFRDNLDDVRGW